MKYNIAVLDGDGIGPEICAGAIKVLQKVGQNSATNLHSATTQ